MKRKMISLIAVLMALVMALAMTACGNAEKKAEEPEEGPAAEEQESTGSDLSGDQMEDLAQQVADKVVELGYTEVMPDEAYAVLQLLDIERNGDDGKAYVYLGASEYVVLKEKAYGMAGSFGEAIVTFTYGDKPVLKDVEWSADGEKHQEWIKENFTEKAQKADEDLMKQTEDGKNPLVDDVNALAEEKLGVPVDTENLLEVDPEKGTYKISEVIESGSPENGDYVFDTKVIEEGELSDVIK
ncbi:MAG: hypothetical protein IKF54_05845 [Eubacterium sp.]|nr:hypothetical protein [Eubacterium sp.]